MRSSCRTNWNNWENASANRLVVIARRMSCWSSSKNSNLAEGRPQGTGRRDARCRLGNRTVKWWVALAVYARPVTPATGRIREIGERNRLRPARGHPRTDPGRSAKRGRSIVTPAQFERLVDRYLQILSSDKMMVVVRFLWCRRLACAGAGETPAPQWCPTRKKTNMIDTERSRENS